MKPNKLLNNIPQPNIKKYGWPWTCETQPHNISAYPKITIITPSYNQGKYLEETIRSVLLQNYPNLEYIIIDGGSTDNSVEIIQKYSPWLYYWVSEKDDGQSDAINKGFAKATGDIITWLNSDDYYEPEALYNIAIVMQDPKNNVVMADINAVDVSGNKIRLWKARTPSLYSLIFQYYLYHIRGIVVMPSQPSVFWRREVYETIGALKVHLQYVMDYEYWLRMLAAGYTFTYIPNVVSNYRFHEEAKNVGGWDNCLPEWKSVGKKYHRQLNIKERSWSYIYWWLILFPLSIVTLPYRSISYFLGVKRG